MAEKEALEVEINLDVLTLADLDTVVNQYLKGKMPLDEELALFRRVLVTPMAGIKATDAVKVRKQVFRAIATCFTGADETDPDDKTKN